MLKLKKDTLIKASAGALLLLSGGAIAGYASLAGAQSTPQTQTDATTVQTTSTTRPARSPHVAGTITAINGSTVTITAEANHGGVTEGTYTIDTSGATITKSGATATLSSFAIGDKLMAEGTITGTNVVATRVSEAGFGMGMHGPGMKGHGMGPGVMGTVSAINGSTITVTGKDGKTYTVEAGSATVRKTITASISDVAVGDTIGVQGTVSGTSVTATDIMDGMMGPKDGTK